MTSEVPYIPPDLVSLDSNRHPRDYLLVEPDLESQPLDSDPESESRLEASTQTIECYATIPTPPFLLSKKEKSKSSIPDSYSKREMKRYMRKMEPFAQHLEDTSRIDDYIQIWGRLIPASTPQWLVVAGMAKLESDYKFLLDPDSPFKPYIQMMERLFPSPPWLLAEKKKSEKRNDSEIKTFEDSDFLDILGRGICGCVVFFLAISIVVGGLGLAVILTVRIILLLAPLWPKDL